MVLSPSQKGHSSPISSEHDEYTTPRSDSVNAFPATPLLLAPPSTQTSLMTQYVNPMLYHTSTLVSRYYHVISPVARFTVFGGKIASLSGPCWPYMPALEVSIPLLCVAALDFGMPDTVVREGRVFRPRRASIWGPWTSLLLLLLHFFVLWMTSRSRVLCKIISHDPWTTWEEPSRTT